MFLFYFNDPHPIMALMTLKIIYMVKKSLYLYNVINFFLYPM